MTGHTMRRLPHALLGGILALGIVPAMAGPAPTAQSIKDQAFASDGYARAMGRLDPDPYRAPIDGDRWERIDTELRTVSATEIDAKGGRVTSDPNHRPQYIVVTYRAKEDLFVEIANVLRTSILRQVVRAGETTVVVADVTPRQSDGDWTVQIDWRNRLPGGLARSAYPNAVLRDAPEEVALQQRAKRLQDEEMARAMAESERQAAYNRQAEEARKIALANLARQNAEDTTTLRATLEPLLGKWVPYTRIEPRRTGEPEANSGRSRSTGSPTGGAS